MSLCIQQWTVRDSWPAMQFTRLGRMHRYSRNRVVLISLLFVLYTF